MEYDRLLNVNQAVKKVARKAGVGVPTVRKAWQATGGLKGWKQLAIE
jgi:hypothetical protein